MTRAFSERALNVTKRIVVKKENNINGISTKTMPLKRKQSVSKRGPKRVKADKQLPKENSATRRSTRNKNRSASYL